MNRKIVDSVVSVMSAAGAVWVITDLVINPFYSLVNAVDVENTFKLALGLCVFIVTSSYTALIRRRHTTLFDLQYTMAENNKLHPLRALVKILYDFEEGNHNMIYIESATFSYTLRERDSVCGEYDVDYALRFVLRKKWYQRVTDAFRIFKVYAISEYEEDLEDVSIVINDKQEYFPVVSACTTKGESGDKMHSFSGLFRIQTMLPRDLNWKKNVFLEIKYTVNKQVKLSDAQYSFVIIPKNYSKKIKEMNVQLFTNAKMYNLHCHRIAIDEKLEQVESFIRAGAPAQPYEIEFKPNMESVYFIQFDLPDQKVGTGN